MQIPSKIEVIAELNKSFFKCLSACVVAMWTIYHSSQQLQCCAALLLQLEWRNLLCDSLDVFKHSKIAKWRLCDSDNLKTLEANYMLIRLLYAYRMTKYVGKISL